MSVLLDRPETSLPAFALIVVSIYVIGRLAFRLVWASAVNLLALTMRPGRPGRPVKYYYETWRWQKLRHYVQWRDHRRCQDCKRVWTRLAPLDTHHVKPVSQGGSWFTWNLKEKCRPCHARNHRRPLW